jgi:hypothetical protein
MFTDIIRKIVLVFLVLGVEWPSSDMHPKRFQSRIWQSRHWHSTELLKKMEKNPFLRNHFPTGSLSKVKVQGDGHLLEKLISYFLYFVSDWIHCESDGSCGDPWVTPLTANGCRVSLVVMVRASRPLRDSIRKSCAETVPRCTSSSSRVRFFSPF